MYCTAIRMTKPQLQATCRESFGGIWTWNFWDMWAHRQTDKHTDMLIAILCTSTK